MERPPQKNYQKVLRKLEFVFPGFPDIPRAPIAYINLEHVDLYLARRKLELLHLLPQHDLELLRSGATTDYTLDRRYFPMLAAKGYFSVIEEIIGLAKEEEVEILSTPEAECYNIPSFIEDKDLLGVLVNGLVECADAEKRNDPTVEKVRMKKMVGEEMVTLGNFWLARKMFMKCLDYLEFVDEESDKMRVELWCLISFVCVYYEEDLEIGFDLPTKFLNLAQALSKDQNWRIQKSVICILIPKAINIYGLKREWLKIKSDWVEMYQLATTLLHVLCLKKARYFQEQLVSDNCQSVSCRELDKDKQLIYENVEDALTSALAYAEEVRQTAAFIATVLRRDLFYEEFGEHEKSVGDLEALFTLCKSYDDKVTLGLTLNRMGQQEILRSNAQAALDCFVQELEIGREHNMNELTADAFKDLGQLLLQEGHTWEADESYSHAFTLFKELKGKSDTIANEHDEVSWGMLGVSKAMHLWGRYATLLRIETAENTEAITKWKSSRKQLPPAVFPPGYYEPHLRSQFDKQYMREESGGNMRLFEFCEIKDATKCQRPRDYSTITEYIHEAEKMNELPVLSPELTKDWDKEDSIGLSKRRTMNAIQKAKSIGAGFTRSQGRASASIISSKDVIPEEEMELRQRLRVIGAMTFDKHNKNSNRSTIEEMMQTFLEDANRVMVKEEMESEAEEEDQSEDTEVEKEKKAEELMKQFHIFGEE